ncbi:MAG: type VI secretion system membrane subunit TssM [Candidatus Eisenbacteria bacterium]|uniref:Type VI secretion system membrane subunit TssM n=1 Tax=Eiseniibacteriota bacterium TaxID=2212470 RepID=A0A956RP59_UNCEI|nr:type VI secretion system membrane subunit TssM [Candidatus Eisenbacteria bacterium]
MFVTLLLRTLLPFGVPILLILVVIFMARSRFPVLQRIPLWMWLAAIGLILVIWGLVLFLRWRKEKADAAAIEEGIMEAAGGTDVAPARRAELDQIRKGLDEAIASLKQGPQGKKALYTIPWYMIIGPPAIGKTTAILNSGLNFPAMTTAKRLRGQGGTRNCDWWFSTDAILLDTAGRYAQSADRSETEGEWFGFLDLLKRHRKKSPINGLILGYSAETLVEQSEDRIINDARELRQRVDEIMTRTGFSFPVYVLFTKCDLIAGFSDFFASFSPVERQQVFGTTFPAPPDPRVRPAELFLQEFDRMAERLRDLRVRRLSTAGRGEGWGRVFMFPEEFVALRPKLHLFVETLFEPNPFSVDQPLFRGTYFSSGKQIGTPFDAVVQRIQTILGGGSGEAFVEEQEEKDDAYFVRDLFSKILRTDQDLTRQSRSGSRRWLRVRLALSAVALVLALGISGLIFSSYARLGSRMADTQKTVAQFDQQSGDLAPDVETLDSLHQLREKVAGSWRAWPLTVADNVRDAGREIYLDALRQRVLQPIEDDVADQLSYPEDLDGDQIRRMLRAELLLLYPERKGEIGDEKDLTDALFVFGIEDAKDHPDSRPEFQDMSKDFLDAGLPLREPDERAREVAAGARGLRRTHSPDAFFQAVVAGASREIPDLTFEHLAGSEDILSTDEVIESAFTKGGWNSYVSERFNNVDKVISADNQIITLAGEAPAETVPKKEDLIELYTQAFPVEWAEFLESVRMRTYSNCDGARDDFKTLKASRNSPLLQLFRELGQEADFGMREKDLAEVAKTLEPIKGFSEAPEGDRAPVSDYREALSNIEDQIAQCSEDEKFTFDPAVFRKASSDLDDFFDAYPGDELTDAMHKLLLRPIEAAQGLLERGKHKAVVGEADSKWDKDVLGPYRSGIAGKYPFTKGAGAASVTAITDLMKAGGALDAYHDVLESSELNPGSNTAAAFKAAESIRGSLIEGGGLSTAFRVELMAPRSLGPQGDKNLPILDRTTLIINGESLVRRSSNRSMNVTWSSGAPDNTCAISIEHTEGNQRLGEIRQEGSLWSWFELVDKARVTRDGNDYTLTWEFPDAEIAVDCRLTMHDGGECPFVEKSTFRRFSLPTSPLN